MIGADEAGDVWRKIDRRLGCDLQPNVSGAQFTVAGGATLTSGIDDWDEPHTVTLASAEDAESRISCLLRYANDVGLFAEEVDPSTGDALGNFPQAFTHIGLVNACLTLQNRLTGREQLSHQRRLPEAAEAGAAA